MLQRYVSDRTSPVVQTLSNINTPSSMRDKLKHSSIGREHGAETGEKVQLLGQIGEASKVFSDYKREQADQSREAHGNRSTCVGRCRRGSTGSMNRNRRSIQRPQFCSPFTSEVALSLAIASVLQSWQSVQPERTTWEAI